MENFEPQLLDRIAVDFYLSQNQVCIDLKSLHRITENHGVKLMLMVNRLSTN